MNERIEAAKAALKVAKDAWEAAVETLNEPLWRAENELKAAILEDYPHKIGDRVVHRGVTFEVAELRVSWGKGEPYGYRVLKGGNLGHTLNRLWSDIRPVTA